jgi:hypothetical protein
VGRAFRPCTELEDYGKSLVSILLPVRMNAGGGSEFGRTAGAGRQETFVAFHILKFHLKGGFGYGLCDC